MSTMTLSQTGEKRWRLKFTFSGRVWLSVDGATHFRKLFSNKELAAKISLRRLLDVPKAIVNQFQRAFETEPSTMSTMSLAPL